MVKTLEARVGEDRVLQVVHGTLSGVRPYRCNWINIVIVGDEIPKWRHP
jgi:hypothetical protein